MTGLSPMPPARQVALPDGGWLNLHEQAGSGPPLVLLHGFTDCAESYRLLLPHLAGRHLVIPDLRGHGRSFRGPILSIDTLAGDIEALVAALGLDRPVVVGHSMGALVAVAVALRKRVDVSALVTISGSLRPASPALQTLSATFAALPVPLPATHPFLDAWYACSRPVPQAFLDRLRASCIAMRKPDWLACLAALHRCNLTAEARKLSVRSLAFSGSEDPIFPHDHQHILTEALRPAHSHVLAGVGHNPHWEAPRQVADLLLSGLTAEMPAPQG